MWFDEMKASSWECIFHYFCKAHEIEYTREQAKVLEDILGFVNDKEASLMERAFSGNPQMFPVVLQEISSSKRFKEMISRSRDIKTKSKNESQVIIMENNSRET